MAAKPLRNGNAGMARPDTPSLGRIQQTCCSVGRCPLLAGEYVAIGLEGESYVSVAESFADYSRVDACGE